MAKGFFRNLLKSAAGGQSARQGEAKTTPAASRQVSEAAPDRAATRAASPPPNDSSPNDSSPGAAELAGEAARVAAGEATPPKSPLHPMTPQRQAIFDEVMRQRARLLETMPEATRQKLVTAAQRFFSARDRG